MFATARAYQDSGPGRSVLLETVYRARRGRAIHGKCDVAALLAGQILGRQLSGLLDCERGAAEGGGALPAFAGELERIALLADFDGAGLPEDSRVGEEVGVGVLPGKFHTASAVL